MQQAAPELLDLSKEAPATLEGYGVNRTGMQRDFSWQRQGGLYVDLYKRLIA